MFNKNFLKYPTYKNGHLIKIISATLLGHDLKPYLQTIKKLSQLNENEFKIYYHPFVFTFIDYVQLIPKNNSGALGGLLIESLSKGFLALQNFLSSHAKATPLERYAIYTASVLQNIHYLVTHYKILLTDEIGNTANSWDPFLEPLANKIKNLPFYKLLPLGTELYSISHSITVLLARQIMPQPGFAWIYLYPEILTKWIQWMNTEDSDNQNVRPVLNLELLPYIEQIESPATYWADVFFQWLKEGLNNQTLEINSKDANIFLIEEGLFIDKAGIFKEFIDLYVHVDANLFILFSQFGNWMGLSKLSGGDFRIEQLISDKVSGSYEKKLRFANNDKNHHRQGILINPNLVFMGKKPTKTNAVKLISNLKLHSPKTVEKMPESLTEEVKPPVLK